jgi:hypothetical protein
MNAPVQRDDSLISEDARLYAPPWARERPLPAAGQPQFTNSPPVASADDLSEGTPAPKERARMPRGGPNISWAPKAPPHEQFTGDVAIQALRRRLTLEPDAVPQPPIVVRREAPFPWIARLGFVCLAAGLGAFCITALTVTDIYPPVANKGDHVEGAGGFTPTGQSSGNFEVTAASLVVPPQGGRATANDPLPLGVTVKDSSGGETVFLSGLENGTRLTAGTPLGSKGWRITARDLGSVLAYAPVDYIGTMHAAINLHAANDAVVDTRVVKLEWIPKVERRKVEQQQQQQQQQQPQAQQQQQQQQQQRPEQTAAVTPRPQLDQEEIGRLIKRGQQLLSAGDIAPARLMLQRAAVAGSAEAALMLGGTYDPDVLREIGVLGFAPNPAKAREWYQKALELGASEASRRLDRLAQAKR